MQIGRHATSSAATGGRRARLVGFAMVGLLACGAAACGSGDDGTDNTVVPADTADVITGPKPTTEGSGPLDSYEVAPSGSSGNSVLGDPMDPSTNDTLSVPAQGT